MVIILNNLKTVTRVTVGYKSNSTQYSLCDQKDNQIDFEKSGIYQIIGNDFQYKYYDQRRRSLFLRFKKHYAPITYKSKVPFVSSCYMLIQ